MSLWKLSRIFLVSFSLIIIIVTSKSTIELFRSSTVFLFGLIYDYARIFSIVKDYKYTGNPTDGRYKSILRYLRDQYPKIITYVGLGLISVSLFISLLGVWGILVSPINTPDLLVIMQDSPVGKSLFIPVDFFRKLLISLWFIICLEVSNPLPGNYQNSISA